MLVFREREDCVHRDGAQQFNLTSIRAAIRHENLGVLSVEAHDVDVLQRHRYLRDKLNSHFLLFLFLVVFEADVEDLAVAGAYHAFFIAIVHRDGCDNACELSLADFLRIIRGKY